MKSQRIQIKDLVRGRHTYPSWSTNTEYLIQTRDLGINTLLHYEIRGNRQIARLFPATIELTNRFCYALGVLRGEGSNSRGKSNYRRLTITNSDSSTLRIVLEQLAVAKLFQKSSLIDKTIHILHHLESNDEAIRHWSAELGLPANKFKCFDDKTKTSPFGVCHIYISDVLLRRVIDLLHEKFVD
jgi:hypothetical protein